MSEPPAELERVSVQRVIHASAHDVFTLVSDPAAHVAIDGSGMLVATSAQLLTAVGDRFDMHMDRRPLGDIPDMAEYDVVNTVTKFDADAVVEWNVAAGGRSPIGHVFGYRLNAISPDITEVESYCDWSAIPQRFKDRVTWPIIAPSSLAQSLDKLARLVEQPSERSERSERSQA